jgi:hypothetical protein
MDDIGLEQQDHDRQVTQLFGRVMGAEPRLAREPKAEDEGQHEEMQRIEAEDTTEQEVAKARAVEIPMHGGDDEAAQHEEDVDGDIARPEQPAPRGIAAIGQIELEMVPDDPKGGEAADRGERQVMVPQRPGSLFIQEGVIQEGVIQERLSAPIRMGSTVIPWPSGPWPPPRPGAARMAAAT